MSQEGLTRSLIDEEIAEIIDEAVRSGSVLHVGEHAKRLHDVYGPSGYSKGRIIDEIILAATNAKVPVEIERT